MLALYALKAGGVTVRGEDTDGFLVGLQLGPFVFEFWATKRPKA